MKCVRASTNASIRFYNCRFTTRKHIKWGWILPSIRPGRGRGWRFIIKSIGQSALVHDSSYYSCIVIKGDGAVVRRALVELAVEKKCLNSKIFRAAHRACAMHLETFKNKRTIAPVMTYYMPRAKDSNDSEAHVWVHPAASEKALHAIRAAVARQVARKVKRSGSTVIVETSDAFARLEIIGQKSFEVVQKLVPRLDFLSERHVVRSVRHFVSHDPRAATLNIDQAPEHIDDEPSETAPTQAEFNVSCRASRNAMLERPWEPAKAIGLKNYSGLLINRGVNASEGYSVIVPKSWAIPLLLGMSHAGARAAGLKEWSWCAQRFGKPVFPDDYLDTPAGVAQRQELFDEIKALMAKTPIGKVPQGLRELEACGRSITVGRVLRTRDALSKAESLATQHVMVRVTLRCPWSGQPSLGSELYVPTAAQNAAWTGKNSGARRRDDVALAEISGESVGYVTSVSAPAAAVGLASALISVKALSLLREKFSRASGRVFVMCKPPGKPVVPAEAHVVVRAAAFDEPWW